MANVFEKKCLFFVLILYVEYQDILFFVWWLNLKVSVAEWVSIVFFKKKICINFESQHGKKSLFHT